MRAQISCTSWWKPKVTQIPGCLKTLLHDSSCYSITDLIYSTVDKREMQYQSIRITSLLIKLDDQWLSSQHQLVNAYKQIWCDDQYQVCSTVKLGIDTVALCQYVTLMIW